MKKRRKNHRIPRTLRDKVEFKVHNHTSRAFGGGDSGRAYRSAERLIDWIMLELLHSNNSGYREGWKMGEQHCKDKLQNSPQFTERLNEQEMNNETH